jgi:hypothetical protein
MPGSGMNKYTASRKGYALICYEYPPDDVRLKLDRANYLLLQEGIEFGILVIKVGTTAQEAQEAQARRDKLKKSVGAFFNRLRGRK